MSGDQGKQKAICQTQTLQIILKSHEVSWYIGDRFQDVGAHQIFIFIIFICKDICRNENIKNLIKADYLSQQSIRYSIASGKMKYNKTEEIKDETADVNFSLTNSSYNQYCPNSSNSPNEIKRFKSLSKIKVGNLMKISDG